MPRPGPGRGWHKRGRHAQMLGGELESCGTDPMTGFYRDGCCDTGVEGSEHTVCAVVHER